jgi:hypothetical protein
VSGADDAEVDQLGGSRSAAARASRRKRSSKTGRGRDVRAAPSPRRFSRFRCRRRARHRPFRRGRAIQQRVPAERSPVHRHPQSYRSGSRSSTQAHGYGPFGTPKGIGSGRF